MIYDAIIIGAGASGIFAAMHLSKQGKKVLMLEKARRLNDTRNTGLGWFGGSARSLVHAFVEPGFGGNITDQALLNLFVENLSEFSDSNLKVVKSKISAKQVELAAVKGFLVDQPNTVVLNEDKMIKMGDRLYLHLKENITLYHKVEITSVKKEKDLFVVEGLDAKFKGRKVLYSMGRAGQHWLVNHGDCLVPSYEQSSFDFGIKLEFPSGAMKAWGGSSKTPFFRFRTEDGFRTSIPSFSGTVETEETNHVKIANTRNTKGSSSTATISLFRTFKTPDALNQVYRLTEICNILADYQTYRESGSKLLGGNSMFSSLPEFGLLRSDLVKFVDLIPEMKPRLVIHGPEARMNPLKFKVSAGMETDIKGLYVIGDMSGHTSSFAQAAASGLAAAKAICK